MNAAIAREQIRPIILVHAVTAAGLHDEYTPDHERVWSPLEIFLGQYERIELYPQTGVPRDALRYEAHEPALVRPSEVFGIAYKDLIAELKENLSYGDTPVQPVYSFVYDWRQDNHYTIRRLAEFVDEVIARTNLMKHDASGLPAGKPLCDCVDFVGHSLGGLVIAGCIAAGLFGKGRASKVRRVVTLGAPFRGSCAAIERLATGKGPIAGRPGRERERIAARVTPSVYQLLPTYHGAVKDRQSKPRDIFDPNTFQSSILDCITEYVELRHATSVTRTQARPIALRLLNEMLSSGKAFLDLVGTVDPRTMLRPKDENGGWLAIIGAGERTLVEVGRTTADDGGRFWFEFDSGRKDDWQKWRRDQSGFDWRLTGDGTVPISSATPPWKDAWKNIVIVQRDDFDWLGELGDVILRERLGLHSALPLMDLAQRWIINFFRPEWAADKKFGQHGKLKGRPHPETPGMDHAGRAEQAARAWNELIPGASIEVQ